VIAFTSDTTTLDPTPDTFACAPGTIVCTRVFVHRVAAGATTRVPLRDPTTGLESYTPLRPPAFLVRHPALSADGRTLAVIMYAAAAESTQAPRPGVAVFSSASGGTRGLEFRSGTYSGAAVTPDLIPFVRISGNGRSVAYCPRVSLNETYHVRVIDPVTGSATSIASRDPRRLFRDAATASPIARSSKQGRTPQASTGATWRKAPTTASSRPRSTSSTRMTSRRPSWRVSSARTALRRRVGS
jgi:hypothetical protein